MTLDVVGIGNAIVDVLARTEDAFLKEHSLTKGSMALTSAEDAEKLYAAMGPAVEISGGSAANTIAGVAALGGAAGFMGKVANDQLGEVFSHDVRSLGVEYTTTPTSDGTPTARSFILVTPDAERTMNTFLGACVELGPDDVDEDMIKRSKVLYLEGYLWDPTEAKKAFLKAMDIANNSDTKVALTLSDSFCVDRFKHEFIELVENQVDILFANEAEITELFDEPNFDKAVKMAAKHLHLVIVTRSEKGAVVISDGTRIDIPAFPTNVEDTTGAGDLYAAGFLHGYTKGLSHEDCGKIAALCASEIISHVGARPETDLKTLVADKLGL